MYSKVTPGLLGLLLLANSFGCVSKVSPNASAPPMPEVMQYAALKIETGHTVVTGQPLPPINYNGEQVPVVKANEIDPSFLVTDGNGGVVIMPKTTHASEPAGYVNAKEFKLKIRELAEQLVAGLHGHSLAGAVALPVSFVNIDDFGQSSSFGHLISEQLYHEFTMRGFPIREYKVSKKISLKGTEGDFYLSRAIKQLAIPANSVVVAGTYYSDSQAIIVNARLIRPKDGRVLRTASMVFQNNALTKRMLASNRQLIKEGRMRIRTMQNGRGTGTSSPVHRGPDIH